MDWLVWALKRGCWWDVREFDYIYPLWRRVEFVSTNQISGSLKARIFVWLCSSCSFCFLYFVCALLACILLITGNLLGDLNKSGSLRAHLLVSFIFICFVSPLTRRIYFVIIYLYVIHSRREDSLTRKTKPDFYVGITKNSVDCLNAGNLFWQLLG